MFIAPFNTKRIRANITELTLRQAIQLCEVPDDLAITGMKEALSMIVSETNLPIEEWTIQECLACMAHYITQRDKEDWEMAPKSPLSAYLMGEVDYPESDNLNYSFEQSDGSDTSYLKVVPLTLEYALAVENAISQHHLKTTKGLWKAAVMAACIFPNIPSHSNHHEDDEEMMDLPLSPNDYVQSNLEQLLNGDEGSFVELLAHFETAWERQSHLFILDFDEEGVFIMPNPQKGGVGVYPPTRFQFDAITWETTSLLFK